MASWDRSGESGEKDRPKSAWDKINEHRAERDAIREDPKNWVDPREGVERKLRPHRDSESARLLEAKRADESLGGAAEAGPSEIGESTEHVGLSDAKDAAGRSVDQVDAAADTETDQDVDTSNQADSQRRADSELEATDNPRATSDSLSGLSANEAAAGRLSDVLRLLRGEAPTTPTKREVALAEVLAKDIETKINAEIDATVDRLNPRYDPTKSAYKENCTGVVQAYELQRRGFDVQPGPLEKSLREDEGGPGGRFPSSIEQAWGRKFTSGTRAEIEEVFKEPGSRGVVRILWHQYLGGGGHVFNVENVGGTVRFLDGQPTPAVHDASRFFSMGYGTAYVRLDDLPKPPDSAFKQYLEP